MRSAVANNFISLVPCRIRIICNKMKLVTTILNVGWLCHHYIVSAYMEESHMCSRLCIHPTECTSCLLNVAGTLPLKPKSRSI